MIQFIFFALFFIAILGGVFSYHTQQTTLKTQEGKAKAENSILKVALDAVGFNPKEIANKTIKQKFSMNVEKGILRVRENMNLVQEQRRELMADINDRNQALENQGRDAQSLMATLKGINSQSALNVDALRMKQVVESFEDQRRIMVENGEEMRRLSDKIRLYMEDLHQKMDMVKIRQEASREMMESQMEMLRQRSEGLMEQQKYFSQRAQEYHRQAKDRSDMMRQKLQDASGHLVNLFGPEKPILQSKVDALISKQSDLRQKIEINRINLETIRQQNELRMESNNERLDALVRENKIKIEDARQRTQEQKQILKDRVADQMQHLRDQTANR